MAGQSQTRVELPRSAGERSAAAPAAPDGMTANDFTSTVSAIATAFGNPTRRQIFLAAHESDLGVTATEMADRFDLHANVARHHLDKLVAGGHLEVTVAKPSGGVGRPSKRYRATSSHVQLEVSVRHDDILVSLLGRALALLPTEVAEQLSLIHI